METEKFPPIPWLGNFKASKHQRVTFNFLPSKWNITILALCRLGQEMGHLELNADDLRVPWCQAEAGVLKGDEGDMYERKIDLSGISEIHQIILDTVLRLQVTALLHQNFPKRYIIAAA